MKLSRDIENKNTYSKGLKAVCEGLVIRSLTSKYYNISLSVEDVTLSWEQIHHVSQWRRQIKNIFYWLR